MVNHILQMYSFYGKCPRKRGDKKDAAHLFQAISGFHPFFLAEETCR